MPSCAVKCCKNNSKVKNKSQGITFHSFPKGNKPWKNDWIKIIKNCRGEEDWTSNKNSVVCSIHFDPSDMYTTEKGLRRLVTYAVPQLHLFKPSDVQEEEPIHSQSSEIKEILICYSSDSEHEFKKEVCYSNNCEQQLTSEPVQSFTPPSSAQVSAQVPPPIIFSEPIVRYLGSCKTSPSSEIPPASIVNIEANNSEEQLLCDSLRKQRIKLDLKRKESIILKQSKKIKSLQQQVRRLKAKNKSLRDMLELGKIKRTKFSRLF